MKQHRHQAASAIAQQELPYESRLLNSAKAIAVELLLRLQEHPVPRVQAMRR
jgi:hypothetical protein